MKRKRSDRSDIKLFERTRNGNGGLQVCRKAKKSDIGVRKLPASRYEKSGHQNHQRTIVSAEDKEIEEPAYIHDPQVRRDMAQT